MEPPMVVRIILALVVGKLAWMILRWILSWSRRPRFSKDEVLFQEWFASGNSRKNFITSLGGASNCLRLVVTRDFLWVTSWFPFALFTPEYDLEHCIPRPSLVSVTRKPARFGRECFVVVFRLPSGKMRELRLLPRNSAAFAAALGIPG